MIEEVKIPDLSVESIGAIPYSSSKESILPKEIISQECVSHISVLKADKSAVSPTCETEQSIITHVDAIDEEKLFCDQNNDKRAISEDNRDNIGKETVLPPSTLITKMIDAEPLQNLIEATQHLIEATNDWKMSHDKSVSKADYGEEMDAEFEPSSDDESDKDKAFFLVGKTNIEKCAIIPGAGSHDSLETIPLP